jgi:hypothetical protein
MCILRLGANNATDDGSRSHLDFPGQIENYANWALQTVNAKRAEKKLMVRFNLGMGKYCYT